MQNQPLDFLEKEIEEIKAKHLYRNLTILESAQGPIVKINGREIEVRVDKLEDTDLRPIFAGLIPFSEGDLPFEITPDI